MTSPEHFRRVDELFRRACELRREDRASWLDMECAGDSALRADVEELLAEDDSAGDFLEEPAVPLSAGGSDAGNGAEYSAPPERIAGYRIRSTIGEGGMGVVYEAEQQSPRRIVALKVIRPELVSPSTLRRFELEAEVLGRLQHPGIAQIYEAGAEAGQGRRLFFAMERIRGRPLLEYAAGLSTRERLALFARICDALQHAHANGVIHRDLKPGNILVVGDGEVGGGGQPKVLDFGVARAIDSDRKAATLHTHIGQIVGTITHMSPEQAAGDVSAVDTRSDVFALGAILFELLTGRLPYDFERKSAFEAVSMIREKEPSRLSTHNSRYRGDLDTIVSKALEKDPQRRYQTAAELAADVRRYLNDEPIQARPATTLYQIRKFAKRNKTIVAASSAILLALVGALAVTTISLGQTRAALARAERQTKIADAVQAFMNDDLLGAADANRLGHDATVRDAIDAAAANVDEKFKEEPVVAGAVHASVGNVYWSLGDLEAAERHLRTATEILRREAEPGDQIQLFALNDLANFYLDAYMPDPAEPLLLESIPLCRKTFGPDAGETLRAESNLARVHDQRGEFDKAEQLLLKLLPRAVDAEGEHSYTAAIILGRLGSVYLEADRHEQAAAMYERALAANRAFRDPGHTATLVSMNNLAVAYEKLGRLDEAAAMQEQLLATEEGLRGRDHPEVLPTLYNLASVYYRQGRFDEAEPLLVEVLAKCRTTFGNEHVGTIRTIGRLGDLYVARKDYVRAEPLLREAAELAAATFGPGSEETLQAQDELEAMLEARGGGQ